MLFKTCLFLVTLTTAYAEVFDDITVNAKAGDTISIPVNDKDPLNSQPDLCQFKTPTGEQDFGAD